MNIPLKPTTLALTLGLALAGAAIAQTAPTAAQQQELDAARASLDQAAKRYAELSRKYGGSDAPIRIEQRVLRKPVIGVLLAPDDASGVRIAGVTPDSAAAAGGLKSGDRIVSIDGTALKAGSGAARVDEVRERLAALDAKTSVKLGYERDGKIRDVTLTPKVGDRLMVLPRGAMADGKLKVFSGSDGEIEVLADRMVFGETAPAAGSFAMIAPDVRTEVIRIGSECKGKDKDCALPVLAEAFRWNGLNLAAVDAQLGRYFGTSAGVLVLSTGKDLDGLQAGDVILKIAGKAVANPREAMDALRAQPAEGKVAVDYLRDRAAATAQVNVPKALTFSLPRMAMAARAPGMPDVVEKRKYVIIDKDGKRSEWEGDAADTPPDWAQALPKDGKRVEKRLQVIVDDKGNKTVIEDASPSATRAPKID